MIVADYGTWESPISSELLLQKNHKLTEVHVNANGIHWIESRPEEKGRSLLMQLQDGEMHELTSPIYNPNSKVHEYGGGSYALADDLIVFIQKEDQDLYLLRPKEKPHRFYGNPYARFADFQIDLERQALFTVEEFHHPESRVENRLALITFEGDHQILHEGHDFYSSPKLSPDGKQLAFYAWDFPNMPWDGSLLYLAQLKKDGSISSVEVIAGSDHESIFQPEWDPESHLYFISDRTGFSNLYQYREGALCPIYPIEADFASPHWVFGFSRYAFVQRDHQKLIAAVYTQMGRDHICLLDPLESTLEKLPLEESQVYYLKAYGDKLYYIGASESNPTQLISYDLSKEKKESLRKSSSLQIPEELLSRPESITFPTRDKNHGYGFYYPPKNPKYQAPETSLPPLIVRCHGGPTGHNAPSLDPEIQFWTSRGFGFFNVNYGGSTGYGRSYRDRLLGAWGIVDVEDTIDGALYLADAKKADPQRLIIKGGSAGGYTAFAAMTFHKVFRAGVCSYGVTDLEILAQETHKFEARYLDKLLGPYPEKQELYRKRSPLHFADQISVPLLVFQGSEDKIVPPNQSEMMVENLKNRGVPVFYHLYQNEGHGFRLSDTQRHRLLAEHEFYTKVLIFRKDFQS